MKNLIAIIALLFLISSCDVGVKKEEADRLHTLYNTNREYKFLYDRQEDVWGEVYMMESKIYAMRQDSIIGIRDPDFDRAKAILQKKKAIALREQNRIKEIEKSN